MAYPAAPTGKCIPPSVTYVPVDLNAAHEIVYRIHEQKSATWQDLCDYWAIFGFQYWWEACSDKDSRWCFANYVERLDLSGAPVNDVILHRLLPIFRNLRYLDLSECEGVFGGGFQFAHLPLLEVLDLSRCCNFTDLGMCHISHFGSLNLLNLSECTSLTDEGFSYLKRMPQLNDLRLTACTQVTDSTLAEFIECRNLFHLDCSGCYQITDDGLNCIGQFADLRYLDLTCC